MSDKKRFIGAMGLIFDENDNILLVQYNYPGSTKLDKKWSFPGGLVELGEHPLEAVKRECLEEINCTIDVLTSTPVVGSENDLLLLGYVAKLTSSNIVLDTHELSNYRWVTISDLPGIDGLSLTQSLATDGYRLLKKIRTI